MFYDHNQNDEDPLQRAHGAGILSRQRHPMEMASVLHREDLLGWDSDREILTITVDNLKPSTTYTVILNPEREEGGKSLRDLWARSR